MRIVLTRRERLDAADGVNIFIVALAQAFVDLNHEVAIVVGCMRSHAQYKRLLGPRSDIEIHALESRPTSGLKSLATWLRAKVIIDQFRPDLIINNEAVPMPFRAPTVHVVHDLEPRRGPLAVLWRSIRRAAMRHSDHIVASTPELLDVVGRDSPSLTAKMAFIPKCIDRSLYKTLELRRRERAVVHCGTESYKQAEVTVGAFAALDDPSLKLYIIGSVGQALHAAVNGLSNRLRQNVIMMGDVDAETRRSLYSRVRVAAFPTRYAVPVGSATVMESVASGTPIIGSWHVSRCVLIDRFNGLAANLDPAAFAAALAAALNDDALWHRLSVGAARVSEDLDATKVAHKYLGLLDSEVM